jgi:phenylpropionate dioxygenase-like ring-hydroxylating dioxygenase large terminal subunit
MNAFITNAWYAAAESAALASQPLRCTLLAQPLVLWRTAAGQAAALLDRCPHRLAPLSMGEICDDAIACPYHGLRFDATGRCVLAPGQPLVPERARAQAFPVIERYGLVFVWMGDASLADPGAMVDLPAWGEPGWQLTRGRTLFRAAWTLIADNLIDPFHTSFVHRRTLGNASGETVPVQARELPDGTIECGRWVENAPPVPIMQRLAGLRGAVDRWQIYRFWPPGASWVDFGAIPAGSARTPEALAGAPYRVVSCAFLSPQDATSTHYFALQMRNFALGDAAVSAELDAQYEATFEEDRLLLEAIERELERDPHAAEALLASDAGVARLRRRLSAAQTADD